MLFAGIPYEILEERAVSFRCSCSRERSAQALRMLEPDDLVALIAEGEAVVDCHFCREQYVYDRAVLEELLARPKDRVGKKRDLKPYPSCLRAFL